MSQHNTDVNNDDIGSTAAANAAVVATTTSLDTQINTSNTPFIGTGVQSNVEPSSVLLDPSKLKAAYQNTAHDDDNDELGPLRKKAEQIAKEQQKASKEREGNAVVVVEKKKPQGSQEGVGEREEKKKRQLDIDTTSLTPTDNHTQQNENFSGSSNDDDTTVTQEPKKRKLETLSLSESFEEEEEEEEDGGGEKENTHNKNNRNTNISESDTTQVDNGSSLFLDAIHTNDNINDYDLDETFIEMHVKFEDTSEFKTFVNILSGVKADYNLLMSTMDDALGRSIMVNSASDDNTVFISANFRTPTLVLRERKSQDPCMAQKFCFSLETLKSLFQFYENENCLELRAYENGAEIEIVSYAEGELDILRNYIPQTNLDEDIDIGTEDDSRDRTKYALIKMYVRTLRKNLNLAKKFNASWIGIAVGTVLGKIKCANVYFRDDLSNKETWDLIFFGDKTGLEDGLDIYPEYAKRHPHMLRGQSQLRFDGNNNKLISYDPVEMRSKIERSFSKRSDVKLNVSMLNKVLSGIPQNDPVELLIPLNNHLPFKLVYKFGEPLSNNECEHYIQFTMGVFSDADDE